MPTDAQVTKAIRLITPTLRRLTRSRADSSEKRSATLLFNLLQLDATGAQANLEGSLQALRTSSGIRDPEMMKLYKTTKRASMMWNKALNQAART